MNIFVGHEEFCGSWRVLWVMKSFVGHEQVCGSWWVLWVMMSFVGHEEFCGSWTEHVCGSWRGLWVMNRLVGHEEFSGSWTEHVCGSWRGLWVMFAIMQGDMQVRRVSGFCNISSRSDERTSLTSSWKVNTTSSFESWVSVSAESPSSLAKEPWDLSPHKPISPRRSSSAPKPPPPHSNGRPLPTQLSCQPRCGAPCLSDIQGRRSDRSRPPPHAPLPPLLRSRPRRRATNPPQPT